MAKTYNCKLVKIALGNHIVSGLAEDSFVTIEELGDGTTSKAGCDGEVVRSVSPDGRCSVKLSLSQTSPTNAYLRKQLRRDRSDGEGYFPIIVKNLTGGEVFSAATAWVVKAPSTGYGKEAGNREWELHADEGEWEE